MRMLNKSVQSIMFAILFVVLLVVVTYFFQAIGQYLYTHDPYKIPRGHAVKVFQQGEHIETKLTMFERLTTYYIYGEN